MYAINVQIYPNIKTNSATLLLTVFSVTVPTVYANMLIIKNIHAIIFNTIILSALFYFFKIFQTRSFYASSGSPNNSIYFSTSYCPNTFLTHSSSTTTIKPQTKQNHSVFPL